VTIRLALGIYLFGGLWMLASSLAALFSLVAAARQASARPLVVWVFPIVGWFFLTLPFGDEARKLEATLRKIS
jgi:UDP-N-acetylmuramyl pentapeptide phosphotransferase/UDP-N-acetylglucosamine-1-phosphate transferase